MEKESINGGVKGQCPGMEIAFRKGRSCFLIQEPRGREGMCVCWGGGCVCVCVLCGRCAGPCARVCVGGRCGVGGRGGAGRECVWVGLHVWRVGRDRGRGSQPGKGQRSVCVSGVCVCKSLQSYPTLCNLMDCGLLASYVQGILQTRILG